MASCVKTNTCFASKPNMFTLARKRAILTQFDFGIFCEQNVLSLNVSVDHMMGVEMGKTLEDKYVHTHKKKALH